MRNKKADRLDDVLEGRSAVHDPETDSLTPLAHALRFSAAEEIRMTAGEDRARMRLRSAIAAQRAAVTQIAEHPRWRMPRVQPLRPALARAALVAAVVVGGTAIVAGPGTLTEPARAAARALGLTSASSTKVEGLLAHGSGNPLTSGKAKGELRTDRTRFSVEVENASSSGIHAVRVTRAGAAVLNTASLTIDIDSFGAGHLELNTQDGAPNVPVVQAGDVVEVVDATGNVILSGPLLSK